jgi:hypothetical protein
MPEIGYNLFGAGEFFGNYSRLVKTHKNFIKPFTGKKAVYIIRNPLSTLKSYYTYNMSMKVPFSNEENFSDFIRGSYGLKAYLKHYFSWKDNIDLLLSLRIYSKTLSDILRRLLIVLDYPMSQLY